MSGDAASARPGELHLTRALVGKIPAKIPDPGPIVEMTEAQSDAARARTLRDVLDTRPVGRAAWVFAIGSLMWRSDFDFAESRRARVSGWQRAFCIGPDTRYRGNPQAPGIMLSLDRGGACDGVAFRLHEDGLETVLVGLIAREPPVPPKWLLAETADGPIEALAFVSDPGGRGYVGGLTAQEIARQIAPAVGMLGSMADYVLNTAEHLQEMGIADPVIFKMQALVAQELEKL